MCFDSSTIVKFMYMYWCKHSLFLYLSNVFFGSYTYTNTYVIVEESWTEHHLWYELWIVLYSFFCQVKIPRNFYFSVYHFVFTPPQFFYFFWIVINLPVWYVMARKTTDSVPEIHHFISGKVHSILLATAIARLEWKNVSEKIISFFTQLEYTY